MPPQIIVQAPQDTLARTLNAVQVRISASCARSSRAAMR
jgi:hypothetical protein